MIVNIIYSAGAQHSATRLIHGLITDVFITEGQRVMELALVGKGENFSSCVEETAISTSNVVHHKGIWRYLPTFLTQKITNTLNRVEAETVICDGLGVMRPLLKVLARAEQLKLMVVVHGRVKFRPSDIRQLAKFSERIRLIAVSHYLADEIASNYPELRSFLRVVPNTIAPNFNEQLLDRQVARVELGLPVTGNLVAISSRLVRKKNVDFVLRSFAVSKSPEQVLVVMGDGPERCDLQQLAEALSISNRIIWLGWVPCAGRYLKAFDLFVSASEIEGFGLSVLEALVADLPVVCSRIPAHQEVLGESASYFEVGDIEGCASLLAGTPVAGQPSDIHGRYARFSSGYRQIYRELQE
ncbi:MAG: glycosyltransferase [Porticoccaceae bacterium]